MRRLTSEEIASYDVVDARIARRVRVQRAPALWPGAGAMTVGRLILVTRDDDRRGGCRLLAHELVHASQYHQLGLWSFLRRYLADYARNLRRLRNHRLAYLAIGLEVEARAGADLWASRRKEPRQGRVPARRSPSSTAQSKQQGRVPAARRSPSSTAQYS